MLKDKWWKLKKLIFIADHKTSDYILPIIIFILFTSLSFIFFSIYNDVYIWQNMKLASGNAFTFCEFNNLGSALVQTANTWSNLGFLFVGLVLVFMGIKDTNFKHKNQANLLLKYPMFSIVMGASILYLFIGSFFYHASVTSFFQMIDQTGMYAIILSFMAYHAFRIFPTLTVKRKGEISSHKIIFYVFLLINSLFIAFLWKINVNILFPVMFLVYLIMTLVYNKRNNIRKISVKILVYSLYFLMFSTAFWILDRQDVLCNPTSVFQGHALWHILNAIALLLVYLHYRTENSLLVQENL